MTKTELISFVERASTYDTKAIEALYKYTYPGAYSLTNHLCANKNDIEDILQESYFTAFSRLDTLRDKAAFPAWLKKIVVNTWRAYAKEKSNAFETTVYDADSESFDDMQYAESALEAVEISETNREIYALVSKLPENQRVCVVLYYYEGMKTNEIAEMLGIPEGSVKSRLYYGRRQLRKEMEQNGLNSVTPPAVSAASPALLAKVLAALGESAGGTAVVTSKALGTGAAVRFAVGLLGAFAVGATVGTVAMWPRKPQTQSTAPTVSTTVTSAATTATAVVTTATTTTTTEAAVTTTTTAAPVLFAAFDYREAGDGIAITRYTGNASDVVIPETLDGMTVTAVDDDAFRYCNMLTSVVIPSTVKMLGNNAFRECRSLYSVTLGSGLESIGGSAFLGCSSLRSVRIPGSVRVINSYAFAYCPALTEAEIDEGTEIVGYAAFRECQGLVKALLPSTVQSIGGDSFDGASPDFRMIAPEGTYAYQYAADKGFLKQE